MSKTGPMKLLRHIRLELARDHEHPEGSREHGYELVVPIDDKGRIDAKAWKEVRDWCRVRRFWGDEKEEVGHVVHKPGGAWAFHYDIHGDPDNDETGYRFESHTFSPGEYVSLKEQDGVLRTFRVTRVGEFD